MTIPFRLIDVFSETPMKGNPLAAVHCDTEGGEAGLDDAAMLSLARWLNLSETTFLLPPTDPQADYKVRIFTLERELPFAGHPTLGSAHAWIEAGGKPKQQGIIMQECGIGLVPVKQQGERLAFAAPPLLKSGALESDVLEEVCAVLNISASDVVDHQWLDNGPGWKGVMLRDAEAVRAVRPQGSWPKRMDVGIVGKVGVVGKEEEKNGVDWEVRAIFSNHTGTMVEDPVTGSLNAAVAQWLYESGRQQGDYIATQGSQIGRDGLIFVSHYSEGEIWVGGRCTTLFSGTSHL